MIRQLHPILKACKCGFIGSRSALYKHFDTIRVYYKLHGHEKDFFTMHGEAVLNTDDPRVTLTRRESDITANGGA